MIYSLCFDDGCYEVVQHGMYFDVHQGRPKDWLARLKLPG
jgi:hypothetical protein